MRLIRSLIMFYLVNEFSLAYIKAYSAHAFVEAFGGDIFIFSSDPYVFHIPILDQIA